MWSLPRRLLLCLLLAALPVQGMASLALGPCPHHGGSLGDESKASAVQIHDHDCCPRGDDAGQGDSGPSCCNCSHCASGGSAAFVVLPIVIAGCTSLLPSPAYRNLSPQRFPQRLLRPPRAV
jgi:hypothetical protein